jgi:hypothetical protein
MGYRMIGRVHASLARLQGNPGQGTVEYVALILLVAGVLAGVVSAGHGMKGAGIAQAIVGKLKESIEGVGGP